VSPPSGSLVVGAGEAEVGDADAAVVADEDVVGLDVAVDEAGPVGRGEALASLQDAVEERLPGPRLGAPPLAQVGADDQLHRHEQALVVVADVVDLDDVGVRQAGERLGLALHALLDVGAVGGLAQQLEGDAAVELIVVGDVDLAHAALGELADQRVAAGEGRGDGRRGRAGRVGWSGARLAWLGLLGTRQPGRRGVVVARTRVIHDRDDTTSAARPGDANPRRSPAQGVMTVAPSQSIVIASGRSSRPATRTAAKLLPSIVVMSGAVTMPDTSPQKASASWT
jgi:hypothetical protein